jgi:hypothetical protein
MKGRITTFIIGLIWVFLTAGNANAWVDVITELDHAEPNACFAGIGEPYPPGPPCPEGSQEKIDQAYVWGLTQEGNSLWFGTGANVLCTTTALFLGDTDPDASRSFVCEYGDGAFAQSHPNLPDQYGDWRQPYIYEYDLTQKKLIDRSPRTDPNFRRSMGLRSAGSYNGVVFLAGGSLNGGIILFAFDANTKAYLGSQEFTQYRSIRKWLVVKNTLYLGTVTAQSQGRVLRWFGSRDNLWDFRVVGIVKGFPRELTEYVDASGLSRIVVSAKTMWVSPAIPQRQAGLLPAQQGQWTEFWSPASYDPDPVTMATYVGGGMQSFNGWVYWGTMHIPGNAMATHESCTSTYCYGEPANMAEYYALYYGTFRATSIWRARNLESGNPEVQLLYGEAQLPAFNPTTHSFDTVSNVGGYVPRYGVSGFGTRLNNYTWVMAAVDNHLFAGTMDSTYLYYTTSPEAGADLWRFDESDTPAVADDRTGLGNRLNYGIRCLIPSDDGTKLFAGMANNMNLEPKGGWYLYQLESFATMTYQITATSGTGGTIAPSGDSTVTYGGSRTYTITANAGYHVADVLVDGVSVGSATSYTFDNVTATHTIQAEFAVDVAETYQITATAGENGTIQPAGETAVNQGGSLSYAIMANSGYHVADVLVDEVSVGAATSYNFSGVNANHSISATFVIDTY